MKQIFNIVTTGNHDIPQQVLSIRIGERYFGFSISRRNSDELLQLTWYTMDEMDENTLREIYLNHPELHHSFYRTVISYDHPSSVLVPDKYYKKEESKPMLETMYGKDANTVIVDEQVSDFQLKNVYAIPGDIQSWIKGHFPVAAIHHHYSIIVSHVNAVDFEGSLIADFRTDDFLLVVSQAKKILLVQTFPYSSPADVLYYLLKACKEFSFSQEMVRLALSGLIEKQSALYKELHQYFLNIRFRDAVWRIPQSEEQQDYPAHFFTSFNDLALCAS